MALSPRMLPRSPLVELVVPVRMLVVFVLKARRAAARIPFETCFASVCTSPNGKNSKQRTTSSGGRTVSLDRLNCELGLTSMLRVLHLGFDVPAIVWSSNATYATILRAYKRQWTLKTLQNTL